MREKNRAPRSKDTLILKPIHEKHKNLEKLVVLSTALENIPFEKEVEKECQNPTLDDSGTGGPTTPESGLQPLNQKPQ